MSRACHLLPLLATADHELQQRVSNEPSSTMDIENVAEDEPHIEMVGGELYVMCMLSANKGTEIALVIPQACCLLTIYTSCPDYFGASKGVTCFIGPLHGNTYWQVTRAHQ